MADAANALNVGLPQPVPLTFLYYRSIERHSFHNPPGIPVQWKTRALYMGTLSTLQALHKTATGKTVIDYLLACGRDIKIQAAPFSNSCAVGPNGMTRVAQELCQGNLGEFVRKAFERGWERAGFDGIVRQNKYSWLATTINYSPLYSLGNPASLPTPQKFQKVTEEQVRSWMKGQSRVDGPHKAHIINSIIVALDTYSEPGEGSGAAIAFYAGEGNTNADRPAGIGLAHELIHAYWAALGRNPGYEFGHDTTVLFEHKCVGLGHWEHLPYLDTVSENQVRREWAAVAATVFEPNDYLNRGSTLRREFYDADA